MDALIYVLKSAGILSIFYLIYFAFLRKDTLFQLKRHYLLAGILVSLLLPLWIFTSVILVEIPISEVTFQEGSFHYEPAMSNVNSWTIDWWLVGLLTYSIGVMVFLFRFSKQLFSLVSLLKNNNWEDDNDYTYIKVSENVSPFSFFKYIVYNEELHSASELEMILKHEQTHAHQWHSVDIILANLISALFWFNPLSWLYKKSIEENLEFIADNETAQQLPSKKEYQLALVKASANSVIPALTNQFYQSFIKKRIVMLNKSNSKKFNSWKVFLVLPLLAIFFYSFNVQEVIEYQEMETEITQEKEFISEENEVSEASEIEEIVEHEAAALTEAVEVETAIEEELGASQIETVVEEYVSPASRNSFLFANDVKIKITKNTTDTQLEAYKTSLKEQGIDFNYSNVKRNSAGEITTIKIIYKSSRGNSGNYHVSDDDGIEDFHFESNDGNVQFYTGESSHNGARARTRGIQRGERAKVRRLESEERRAQMAEKRVVVRGEMRERQKAMSKRMQAREKRLRKQQDKLNKKRAKLYHNSDNNTTYRFNSNQGEGANVWISKDGTVHESHGNVEVIVHDDGQHKDDHVNVWISKDGKVRKYEGEGTFIHEEVEEIEEEHENDEKHQIKIIRTKPGNGIRTIQRGNGSTVIIEEDEHSNGYLFLDFVEGKEPYIVVDGMEYKGKLADFSPNDLEKVEVLKGSSAIRYGEKGKNGVVEITTKKN